MTLILLGLFGVAALAALIFSHTRSLRAVSHMIDRLERPESAAPDGLEGLEELENRLADQISDLTLAVAEGIEHADRSERRVRAVVQGAKRRMESAGYLDPGVEAEAEALSENDAASGGNEGLLPMQDDVATAGSPWNNVPGIVR